MRRLINLTMFGIVVALIFTAAELTKLMHMQAMVFAHPERNVTTETPTDYGITTWETISFTAADGIELKGWYLPPPTETGATILFVHGIAGNRANYLPEAAHLYEKGYGALLFDLRNSGESGGQFTTLGILEAQDVVAAYDFLADQPAVNKNCITVYGGSMGGASAILAMPRLPNARALIVDATYTSFEKLVEDGIRDRTIFPDTPFAQIILWMTGRETHQNIFDARPIDIIGDIAPRPFFLMHGTNDGTIPVDHAYEIYTAAKEPKFLYIVEGGGHGGLMQFDPAGYDENIIPFLATYGCDS